MSYSYRAAGTSGLPTQADLKHWNPASPSANSPFGQPSLEDWAAFLEASRPMDDLAGSTIVSIADRVDWCLASIVSREWR